MNKYLQVIKDHSFTLTDEQVTEKVNTIIAEKFAENNTKEVYKKLYGCIDLTTLNSTDTKDDVWRLVNRVNSFEDTNPEVKNVAAICVFPNFTDTVKEALTADVKIACVSAGFPSSQTFTEVKIAETALAVADGADEIDVVVNLGMFLGEEYEEMCEELHEIKHACKQAHLKVILETGALKSAENIYKASILSIYSGADFLKTSTGKTYAGATPEAAYVMCSAIKSYYGKTGQKIGFKVSGGVAGVEDAVKYFTIIKEILGEEWCCDTLFRVGASKLADVLLREIG
jgi:deoxyribose-phosphate aldolase